MYDTLSYDEQILSEKLGIYDTVDNSINEDLRNKLLTEQLEREKRKNKHLEASVAPKDPREHFSMPEAPTLDIKLTPDTLKWLVLLMFVVCIVQYVSNKNEVHELKNMLLGFRNHPQYTRPLQYMSPGAMPYMATPMGTADPVFITREPVEMQSPAAMQPVTMPRS